MMLFLIIKRGLFLILLIGMSAVCAQIPDFHFHSANRAYADGKYHEAIELYQNIVKEGMESGEVYFNLGNAYYKVNQFGQSILYYEKAKQFLEGDPALEHNLRLAQLNIVDKIDVIPMLFIEEWWLKLTHLFSITTLLWLSLAFFTISMIVIILRIFFNNGFIRRIIWPTMSIFIFIFIITIGQIYEFETSKFGVILEEKVSVVSEPGLSGTEVFILHEGTKVKINRILDDWFEISIPDGKTGWLRASDFGMI